MMIPRSEIHTAMQRQASRHREANQSQPRPARVRFSVRTKGVGEIRLVGAKGIVFGALMLEEPTLSFGVVADEPLQLGQLPLATAVVLGWKKNANGVYLGADMGFKVECAKSDVQLRFDLSFEGSTMRSTFGHGTSTTTDTGKNQFGGADPETAVEVTSL